jgi:hypothetical protein
MNSLHREDSIHLMNQLTNDARMLHQEHLSLIIEQEEMNLFVLLKPKLYQDGDMWCVLYGENIQEGICGFGKSPMLAIYEFNKAWKEELKCQ